MATRSNRTRPATGVTGSKGTEQSLQDTPAYKRGRELAHSIIENNEPGEWEAFLAGLKSSFRDLIADRRTRTALMEQEFTAAERELK